MSTRESGPGEDLRHLIIIALLGSVAGSAETSLYDKMMGKGDKKIAVPSNPPADTAIAADASVNTSCASPHLALKSFFYAEGSKRLECFDHSKRTTQQLSLLAERLLKVLRGRGVVVDVETVPKDPNYQAPTSTVDAPSYVLSPKLPGIYLERKSVGWIFPNESIDTIDGIYAELMRSSLGALHKIIPEWALVDIFGIDGFSIIQIVFFLLLLLAGIVLRLIVIAFISHHTEKFFVRHGMGKFEEHLKKAASHIGNLLLALTLILFIPALDLNVHITSYLIIASRLGAAISTVMIAYRGIDLIAHFLLQKALKTTSRLDDQLVPLFGRGLKIVTVIVGGIFVLQNLNVDVTSLLAGVTIGGLAISFAAKDTVANLFGSITIFADKPFLVGDWIRAADVEGIVEVVGFRSTRIRTFYNSLVTVPNSKFTESVVDNMGARRFRRNDTKLMLPFDTDPELIEAFCNGIRAIIKAHPKTRKDAYEVHLSEFGDYCVKIMVFYFADVGTNSQEFRTRHEIFLDILRLAQKLGLRFALPTQSLFIDRVAQPMEEKPREKISEELLNTTPDYFAPKGAGVIPPGPRLGKPYFSDQLPDSAYR